MAKHPLLPPVAFVGIASISTAAVLIKLCDDAPPGVIAAGRLGVAAVILLAIMLAMRGRPVIRMPAGKWPAVILAGLLLGAHFFFWITSLKHTSVMSSVVIATTNPIFVGIASYFLFKEPIRRALVMGILLASLGGGVIAFSDHGAQPEAHSHNTNTANPGAPGPLTVPLGAASTGSHLYGDLMALLGAIMASCYYLVGRKVRGEIDLLSYILPVYAIAALVPAIASLYGRPDVTAYRTSTYIYILLLAVVPQLIGHGAINWCLRYVSATTVAIFILGEPIGASILAYIVQGEAIKPMQAVGGGLILLGVFVTTFSERRPKNAEPAGLKPGAPSGTPPQAPLDSTTLDSAGT